MGGLAHTLRHPVITCSALATVGFGERQMARGMRDTRKQREALVIIAATGVAAVIGQLYIGPILAKKLNVKR